MSISVINNPATLQQQLLDWFAANGRDLPWRHTRDPYRVLVSEIMLQQTQVERVLPKYQAFLEAFPTVEALASASPADVIRAWQGLGYNRRAINLQRAAQAVVEAGYPDDQSAFPATPEALRKLPGIGPYTAGAVACFAFEQDVAFMDTNIRRVIQRVFMGPETNPAAEAELLQIAAKMIPAQRGWAWNQALMELGATICTAQRPQCWRCPVQSHCTAYQTWSQADSSIELQIRQSRRLRKVAEQPFQHSNRFFRGRVIDVLRDLPADSAIALSSLGPRIRDEWQQDQSDWLARLVDGLVQDGLAVWCKQEGTATETWEVALPH